ncbi:MAG: effector binding domain-containing protein [Promethearchaeota archaeon]
MVELHQMKVLSFHSWGEYIGDPEIKTLQKLKDWLKKSKTSIDPTKHQIFGFDNPVPQVNEKGEQYASKENPYGYEVWITIPNDFKLEGDLNIKKVKAGLYAVISIKNAMNIGHGWKSLFDWISNSEKYDFHPKWKGLIKYYDKDVIEHGIIGLEHHINYPENEVDKMLLDIYAPIIEKN